MRTVISAVFLSFTMMGAAYATEPSGELDYPPVAPSQSTLTHAQVQAELQAAKAAGQVTFGELEMPTPVAGVAATPTREDVQAELREAQARGLVPFGELDYQSDDSKGTHSHG